MYEVRTVDSSDDDHFPHVASLRIDGQRRTGDQLPQMKLDIIISLNLLLAVSRPHIYG